MNYEIHDEETLTVFRRSTDDAALLDLVERLVTRTKVQRLWDSTCIVVGEPTADLLGFDPVAEPPDWAWHQNHGGWVELGLILDAFTWVVLVPSGSTLAANA